MLVKSKIKWVALGGLVLSFVSLLVHLLLAKYSSADLVRYSAITGFTEDLNVNIEGRQVAHLFLFFIAVFVVFMILVVLIDFIVIILRCFSFLSSNCYRALDIASCGKMLYLLNPCSLMPILEVDILVMPCLMFLLTR